MRKQNQKQILQETTVSVYVYNSDGSDCSNDVKEDLKAMGASVRDAFGFGQTHLIFSNGDAKLLQAADIFGIKVVSYLWVQQCKQAGKRVDEADFLVTSADNRGAHMARRGMEPVVGQVGEQNVDNNSIFN